MQTTLFHLFHKKALLLAGENKKCLSKYKEKKINQLMNQWRSCMYQIDSFF